MNKLINNYLKNIILLKKYFIIRIHNFLKIDNKIFDWIKLNANAARNYIQNLCQNITRLTPGNYRETERRVTKVKMIWRILIILSNTNLLIDKLQSDLKIINKIFKQIENLFQKNKIRRRKFSIFFEFNNWIVDVSNIK